jgi:hypothetical protein
MANFHSGTLLHWYSPLQAGWFFMPKVDYLHGKGVEVLPKSVNNNQDQS